MEEGGRIRPSDSGKSVIAGSLQLFLLSMSHMMSFRVAQPSDFHFNWLALSDTLEHGERMEKLWLGCDCKREADLLCRGEQTRDMMCETAVQNRSNFLHCTARSRVFAKIQFVMQKL